MMASKKTGLKFGAFQVRGNDLAPPEGGHVWVNRDAANGRFMSVPGIGKVTILGRDMLSRANQAANIEIQSTLKRPAGK
jgi:hypothetical protein